MNKRLREELAKLQVEINEEKSRIVDLGKGESFGFLGFEFRRVRSLKGRVATPLHAQAEEADGVTGEAQGHLPLLSVQTVGRVVALINPILRGWVNYFAIGDSSRCFGFIKDWVEKKMRRHLMRARKRRASAGSGGVGSGCMRLGLFDGYRRTATEHCRKLPQQDRSHNP